MTQHYRRFCSPVPLSRTESAHTIRRSSSTSVSDDRARSSRIAEIRTQNITADSDGMGASAKILQNLWHLGMTISDIRNMKDYVLVLFAFSFNGLRKILVLLLKYSKRFLQCRNAFAHCTIWKGRVADCEQLLANYATNDTASPLDLFEQWLNHRRPGDLLFGQVNQTTWPPQNITHACNHLSRAVGGYRWPTANSRPTSSVSVSIPSRFFLAFR